MRQRGPGMLQVIGVGPGDPELLTLKAARRIAAAPVVAFFAKRGCASHARAIVGEHVRAEAEQLRFEYPFTTELNAHTPRYRLETEQFYGSVAAEIAARLAAERDVALLCEGDPFLYGSAIHVFERLHAAYPCEVIPGVSGMSACWSAARLPIVRGENTLAILPATLDAVVLGERLAGRDAAVFMKVGRNLAKIRNALEQARRADEAVYVEYGSMADQRVMPLAAAPDAAPYFSLVLVAARA
jgi:precorrin-2/cobalt-factor-2 C20-methyltransferase